MAKPTRKRRAKIKVRQSAQLVHKNDKTRVARDTLQNYRKNYSPTPTPRDNAATFKIKIRRK